MPDLTSLATPAATLLKASGQSIAIAESSCGGLISAALVSIPGASAYYVGGSTIYTRVAQKGLLLVPDETNRKPVRGFVWPRLFRRERTD